MILIKWDDNTAPCRDCDVDTKAYATILTGKFINQGGEDFICSASNLLLFNQLIKNTVLLNIPKENILIIDKNGLLYNLEEYGNGMFYI